MAETFEEHIIDRVILYLSHEKSARRQLEKVHHARRHNLKVYYPAHTISYLEKEIASYEKMLLQLNRNYPDEYLIGKMKYGH